MNDTIFEVVSTCRGKEVMHKYINSTGIVRADYRLQNACIAFRPLYPMAIAYRELKKQIEITVN